MYSVTRRIRNQALVRTHLYGPILYCLPLATRQTSTGLESTKKKSSLPSIAIAICLRIFSHSLAVLFLQSLNCLRDIRLGILSLYSLSFDSNSQFSLSILSDSAARDNATISKSENLGTGPRRGIFSVGYFLSHSQIYWKTACIS